MTQPELPPELQFLLDEREIMRGLSIFARALDQRDWAALAQVYAQDVTFDYGSGDGQCGLNAIVSMTRSYLDRCGPTQHLIGSVTVEIEDSRATSRAYVRARHQRKDDLGGPVFDTNGEFIDHWQRSAEGWRIVRRIAEWQSHSGDPSILFDQAQDES